MPILDHESELIEINGVQFRALEGVEYKYDYVGWVRAITEGRVKELDVYRELMLNDLWFLLYFGLRSTPANHRFLVECCREVEGDEESFREHRGRLYLWARGHWKSSIITVARNIQRVAQRKVLGGKDLTVGIFSYSREAAEVFLNSIKHQLETNGFLKACFPDVFWQDPAKQAYKWGEKEGLYCIRSTSAREATFEACGLLKGMPTGRHYGHRTYDDVMVEDLTDSPEQIYKLRERFDLSANLGMMDGSGTHEVVGTPYHHEDLPSDLRTRVDDEGRLLYDLSLKPATVDGRPNGEPVFMHPLELKKFRQNPRRFRTQQLLDPTPKGEAMLDPDMLKVVTKKDLPPRLHKLMAIDPAHGRQDNRRQDAWAILLIGVEPYINDLGASKIFILDAVIEEIDHQQGIDEVVSMYLRSGRVVRMGVEKVAQSTAEIHICNALRAKGRYVSVERGNLEILRPGGRSKSERIEANLLWPLNNGFIHVLDTVPQAYLQRLRMEMERFPFWHDDGIDALSYIYDMLAGFKFWFVKDAAPEESLSVWDRERPQSVANEHGWMKA